MPFEEVALALRYDFASPLDGALKLFFFSGAFVAVFSARGLATGKAPRAKTG
ncbi:MAG: hypothetical protein LBR11_01550 [Deltaproteobacteria bacterium]|nr:hypothetical protein [Deltaproteobacteria bacterium]